MAASAAARIFRRSPSTCLRISAASYPAPIPAGRDHSNSQWRKVPSAFSQTEKLASTTVSGCARSAIRSDASITHCRHSLAAAIARSKFFPALTGDATTKSASSNSLRIVDVPLPLRIDLRYSTRRAVCPARGIGLPASTGAARASRPEGARFFMVGRVVSSERGAAPVGGKTNHGASGHQRVPTMWGPYTGIGPRGRTISTGDRP